MADKRSGTGRSAVMAMGQVVDQCGHSGRPPTDRQRQLWGPQPDLTHSANCGRLIYRNHGHSSVRSTPKPVSRSPSAGRSLPSFACPHFSVSNEPETCQAATHRIEWQPRTLRRRIADPLARFRAEETAGLIGIRIAPPKPLESGSDGRRWGARIDVFRCFSLDTPLLWAQYLACCDCKLIKSLWCNAQQLGRLEL